MATAPTADAFAALLRAEGLTVVEVGRWQTHNRNHKGPWGPVHGVMIHHTVTKGTANTVKICRDGYTALPGPLCHGVIAKDGTVHLIGYGRTNHAGLGDDDVLRAVQNETPLPADNEANTDGNRYFYGFECENLGDGKDPWPQVQLEAIERVSAALCRYHRWGPRSVIGHLEWQPGKVDPRGFTMDSMRDRIADRLAEKPVEPEKPPVAKPGTKPPAKPAPVPAKPVVDLSKLVAAAKADPPKRGTPISYYGSKTVEQALVAEGLLARSLADGHFGSSTVTAYAAWQRRCGFKGADANGIPGRDSLERLGQRRGFTVTA
ncbi:N-acetylmuramoyl-L-alanine amidase [Streptomyces lunaelactis]|uniref:N-acetylmuramoyl-L-alanine amidase n=1 Tax=Streptomyces lunaelactis TaxID=1535768 RepID=UPI001585CD07|nr:N-acetylmuramoyl-L-alanine amidase [Streptomyces lunaelactis]NUK22078.1 N-acetylmuramoyl-L-alanine amidase [Streptomyces lunaelactis]